MARASAQRLSMASTARRPCLLYRLSLLLFPKSAAIDTDVLLEQTTKMATAAAVNERYGRPTERYTRQHALRQHNVASSSNVKTSASVHRLAAAVNLAFTHTHTVYIYIYIYTPITQSRFCQCHQSVDETLRRMHNTRSLVRIQLDRTDATISSWLD